MKLYEISAEIEALENAAEDEMLIDPETGELMTIEQALDQLRMAKEEKVENIALMVKNLDAESIAIQSEEKRLFNRRKVVENKAAKMRAYLISCLTRADGTTERVKTARASVSVRLSGPSVVISDEALLPDVYRTTKITQTINKTMIAEVLRHGDTVPGAHFERGRSVMIK